MVLALIELIATNKAFAHSAALVRNEVCCAVLVLNSKAVNCLRQTKCAVAEGVPAAAKVNGNGVFTVLYIGCYVKLRNVHSVVGDNLVNRIAACLIIC